MVAYPGYIPPNTELHNGDYTTSPSGMYYGQFVTFSYSGGGFFFWIVPGSNPDVAPCCFGYDPTSFLSNNYLGGYFVHMQTDGNFVVYTSATGLDQGTVIPVADTGTQQGYSGAFFAQVGDDGSFTVYSGSGPSDNNGALSPQPPNHSHGAVTGIDLTNITYDMGNAHILSQTGLGLYSAQFENPTSSPVQFVAQQNISYTQTASFSFSVADAVSEGISANVTWGIPGIAKDSIGFSITNTTTITHGHADSSSSQVTFIAGARPNVPAFETYDVSITGTQASYEIPYSWTGVATYGDGTKANVIGDGKFTGASEGNFQAVTTCVLAVLPQTCAPGSIITPALISPVTEPGTAMLFPLAVLGSAVARRFRQRSGPVGPQRARGVLS